MSKFIKKQKPVKQTKNDEKNSGGRPSIYDSKLHPMIAKNLCESKGFILKELAKAFGVTCKRIEHWISIHKEFKEAIKLGKDNFDGQNVENALLKRALGYEYTEVTTKQTIIKSKELDKNGKEITIELPAKEVFRTIKQVIPETKACMFWLQNRNPERWRNTQYLNVEQKGTINHKHDHEHKLTKKQLEKLETDELRALKKLVTATAMVDRENTRREEPNQLH